MDPKIDFSQIISSFPTDKTSILTTLHETALALGYTPKISQSAKNPDNWKCEYIATKPKRELYILNVTGQQFIIRAKLYHLAEYCDILDSCTEHCKASLLAEAKDCGSHGGSCAGPITFAIDGIPYTKCRHFLAFTDITPEDVEGICRLLQTEARLSITQ